MTDRCQEVQVAADGTAGTIGARLRAARQAHGLQVEDVSAATRIRGGLIRSIEADEFEPCGGAVYARGHLRTIAGVVGLDPVPLVAEFDRLHGAPTGSLAPAPVAPPRVQAAKPARPSGLVLPGPITHPRRRPSWPLAAGLALVIVIIIAAADLVANSGGTTPGHRPPVLAVGHPKPTPTVTSTSAPSNVSADAGVNVVVHDISQPCWISVKNQDQQVLFTGLLQPGQVESYHALQSLQFVVGNAGAFDATVNGRPAGSLGGFGTVKTTTFTATGQNAA
jgi:cytoskeleton protein RodZ